MQILPKHFNRLCALLIFTLFGSFIYAQETQISYTTGGEFSLSSNGYRVSYPGSGPDTGALSLGTNDIIQTEEGCFVELRLEPGGTRINIAENTSLVCNGPGREALSLSFTLLYGKLRVTTSGIWPHGEGSAVYIQSGKVETVFRQGDAGIDYIVDTSGTPLTPLEPVLTVYNFSGSSEIRPGPWYIPRGPGTPRSFHVFEYESLTIEIANSLSYIERRYFGGEIINYWNRHNYSGNAPFLTMRTAAGVQTLPAPVPAPAPAAPASAAPLEAAPQIVEQEPIIIERIEYVYSDYPQTIIEQIFPDNPFHKKLFRVKNFLISSGMVFTAGGIGMQIAGSYGIPSLDKKTNTLLFNLGYVPLVMGLIFSGAGLVINPQNMVTDAAN